MNILWINHRDIKHPQAGGAEVRIFEIASRLVAMGYRVTLLSESIPGLPDRDRIKGVDIIRMGGKLTIHLKAPIYVSKYSGRYDIIIDDIAHAVPWYSPLFSRKPVIAQIHHIHQDVVYLELNSILARLIAGLEKTIPWVYMRYITVSESTKRELVARFNVAPERVKVVPNGVDTDKYKPGRKSDEPTILWVGRIKKYKNLDHIIKAFKIIEDRVPDSRLVIIGDGELRDAMISLSRKLGVRRVYFLGRVPEEEKIRWMRRAWLIASASIVEGWGLTITEAGASGTPAVGYRVPGLVDSVIHGETGLLVEPGDIDSLARVMENILTNHSLREKLSRGAYLYAREHSWDVIARRFAREIERLAGLD